MGGRTPRSAFGLILGLGLLSCNDPVGTGTGDSDRVISATYVGREACAPCHQEELDLWHGSHHDLAMQPATQETVLGDFQDSWFTHFGITSTFYRRDAKYLVQTEAQNGEIQEFEITHTFGVEPLQQYLVRFPQGRFQALGICWDTRPAEEGGQRWFALYPDERIGPDDPLHWTGVYQTWNHQCAECHSTNLKKRYSRKDGSYETTWSEIDVSCEACHGPASEHVAWAQRSGSGGQLSEDELLGLVVRLSQSGDVSWVFDPGESVARRSSPRDSQLEMETCGRCHSRRSQLSEDYVHGQPLLDTHRVTMLDEGLYHPDGQIQDEVCVYGSFLQSKMYLKGVSCSDCHQPHRLSVYGGVDGVCRTCHLEEKYAKESHHFHQPGSSGASCVECHMPARNYMVVDGRRDHSFRVPDPHLSLRLGTPNACNQCHQDQSVQWAADAVARWYGSKRSSDPHFGDTLFAGRRDLPGAQLKLLSLARDEAVPGIARASALSMLNIARRPESQSLIEDALASEDPLMRMAAVTAAETMETAARLGLLFDSLADPVLAVRLEALRVLADVPAELWGKDRLRRRDRILVEYEESFEFQSDRSESHYNRGLLQQQLGNLEEAEESYMDALEIAPHSMLAYVNLADIYRAHGRDEQGEALLRKGLRINPESAPLQHSLGLLLVRRKQRVEALEWLRKAAETQPEQARYGYVYGIGLQSTGHPERALEVLKKAQARHPGDRDLLVGVITVARQERQSKTALTYARKLMVLSPGNPGIRNLVAQLEAEVRPGNR